MPSPETVALLAEADPLPYPQRMVLFAGRARALAESGRLAAVLAELRSGDRFQREVALFMAVVAGHSETIAAALHDPDWRLRCRALSAWLQARPADAGAVAHLLEDAPAQTRQQVYRLVRAGSLPGLAEELVGEVRSRFGEREAARLLPGCGAATVARLLPELGYAVGNWSALARRHPDVVLVEAARQLDGLTAPGRAAWWRRYGSGILAAGAAVPHRVLDLLERFAPPTFLPGDLRGYGVLAAADPERLLRLLAAPGRAGWLTRTRLPRTLLSRFGRLEPAALTGLARRLRDAETLLAALLKAVPPRHRSELYDAATGGVDRSQARPGEALLAVLPHERRVAEARRILGLGPVRDDEALTLYYTAYLPWPESEVALTAATRRGQADDRAVGYELMLACAGRTGDPATVTQAVSQLARLRNEQDPVRARALAALARLASGLIQPDTAETLERLVTDAVQARDSSGQTMHALSTVAVTVLRHHVDSPPLLAWALRTLERLFGGDRVPALGRLDTLLRRGQEREVFTAVRPWIEAGITRGKYEPLFAIARGLHARAWRLPELQALLRRAIDPANVSPVVRQGVSLWLADPSTRSVRVEEVLFTDASTVTLPEVWNAMCTRRTDLLDLVLTGSPPKGRFLAAGVRWVPTYAPHVRRWLPRQQQAYAGLLARLAADAGTVIHTRAAAVVAAARIPTFGWPVVRRYLDSSNINLAEAALAALAWTDRPAEALPILLAHADDDRARVATYAAGRAARFVAPSHLYAALAGPASAHGKVTSRKEAVRLLTRLAVPGAPDVLRAVWDAEGQHRDVRAAVVSAVRQRLDDPRVWPILDQAADGGREETLALLAVDPFDVAEQHRPRYAELVNRACQTRDGEVSRAAWQAFPAWAQWTPDAGAGVLTRLTDLEDRTVWRTVIPAVVALVDAGLGRPVVVDVLSGLVELDTADPTHADPQRDRPARRRIDRLVDQLVAWAGRAGPDADRSALRAAGQCLTRHPDLVAQGAQLLIHAVTLAGDDPNDLSADLAAICDLVADRPVAASRLAQDLADRLGEDPQCQPDAVRAVAEQLGGRGDIAGGLFSVALSGHGARFGWPRQWRDLILQLRGHHRPDVRTAALNVAVAVE